MSQRAASFMFMERVDLKELEREVEVVTELRRRRGNREREERLDVAREETARAEALVARFGAEIRTEIARGTPARLFGSPPWTKLRGLYNKLDAERWAEPPIPRLRICWDHEAAFFDNEQHGCKVKVDVSHRRYIWELDPLCLRELYGFVYTGGYASVITRLSCWDELGALEAVVDPSVRRSRAQRQAELILCSVRLLAAIADGTLVDLVAAELRDELQLRKFADPLRHGCAEGDDECLACSQRDCPYRELLHYHHDGCPECGR